MCLPSQGSFRDPYDVFHSPCVALTARKMLDPNKILLFLKQPRCLVFEEVTSIDVWDGAMMLHSSYLVPWQHRITFCLYFEIFYEILFYIYKPLDWFLFHFLWLILSLIFFHTFIFTHTHTHIYIYIYIYIHILPVKSFWKPSKNFIPHPKSAIFNETS